MVFFIAINACKKTEVGEAYKQNGYYIFEGTASSEQVVPSGASASTGTAFFSGVYDANSGIFNYTLSWDNLLATPNNLVFRAPADSGAIGLNMRSLALSGYNISDTLTGVFWSNAQLNDNELSYLKKGQCYFVIASTSRPIGTISTANSADGGEIRGQIRLKEIRK